MTLKEFSQLKLGDMVTYNGSLYRVSECSEASGEGTYSIGISLVNGTGRAWLELLKKVDDIKNLHNYVDISA